jgi:hypothetical protein
MNKRRLKLKMINLEKIMMENLKFLKIKSKDLREKFKN